MKYCIVVLGIIFMITSCSAPKGVKEYGKLLKNGKVEQKSFKKTISFEYRKGLIVLPVEIKGKTYQFVLDTGASNVITKELQKELQLEVIGKQPIGGSENETKNQDIVAFDNVSIAGLDFKKTIGAVVDLNAVPVLRSLKIDGIIGSNLMRHAIWDFNFPQKTITITNSEKTLDIPKTFKKSKFFIGYQGAPFVTTKVNGERILSTTIDFGYNGSVKMARKHFNVLNNKQKLGKYIEGNGSDGTGVYGAEKTNKLYKVKTDKFEFGNLSFKNTIICLLYTSPSPRDRG